MLISRKQINLVYMMIKGSIFEQYCCKMKWLIIAIYFYVYLYRKLLTETSAALSRGLPIDLTCNQNKTLIFITIQFLNEIRSSEEKDTGELVIINH